MLQCSSLSTVKNVIKDALYNYYVVLIDIVSSNILELDKPFTADFHCHEQVLSVRPDFDEEQMSQVVEVFRRSARIRHRKYKTTLSCLYKGRHLGRSGILALN